MPSFLAQLFQPFLGDSSLLLPLLPGSQQVVLVHHQVQHGQQAEGGNDDIHSVSLDCYLLVVVLAGKYSAKLPGLMKFFLRLDQYSQIMWSNFIKNIITVFKTSFVKSFFFLFLFLAFSSGLQHVNLFFSCFHIVIIIIIDSFIFCIMKS